MAVCVMIMSILIYLAYIATQRFDGSEVMIQYGTGSYSGHSVIAFRVNGTLHVCESNGKNRYELTTMFYFE